MSKRRKEFMVGEWVEMLTAAGAVRQWKAYHEPPNSLNEPIFRLVKVPLAKVKAQAARERKTKKGKA